MKTSNKILSGLIAFIGLCFLCFLIYAKSQMIDNTHPEWDRQEMQKSGEMQTTSYNNLAFEGIGISGNFDYVLEQGPNKVTIQTDKNYQNILKPAVDEGVLRFYMESDRPPNNYEGFNITISAPVIKEISVSGSARLITPAAIQSDNLRLNVSGASRTNLDIKADQVNIQGGGKAHMNLQGTAEKMDLDVSGSTNIDALNLKTGEITLNASGASHTRVYAAENLSVTAAGTAQIIYDGDAQVSKNLSGTATAVKKQ